MKKLFLLFLFSVFFNCKNIINAQSLNLEETKKILCSNKWFLRRFEEYGKMFTVPKDMQGMKMVFKTDGTLIVFFPDEKESEAKVENWTITKTEIKVENSVNKYAYKYILKDFIGYKLYLTLEGSPTFVLTQADRIINTAILEKQSKLQTINDIKYIDIGQQIWALKNLNTEHFRNGDRIKEASTKEEWQRSVNIGQPAWCYSMDDALNGQEYGKLYNWHAVNDPRGLAPAGWHVPGKNEIDLMVNFLGGVWEASKKMKTSAYWVKNGGGTNSSGFSALPGGCRKISGDFKGLNFEGFFWTTTLESMEGRAIQYVLSNDKLALQQYQALFGEGCSVRCVRD